MRKEEISLLFGKKTLAKAIEILIKNGVIDVWTLKQAWLWLSSPYVPFYVRTKERLKAGRISIGKRVVERVLKNLPEEVEEMSKGIRIRLFGKLTQEVLSGNSARRTLRIRRGVVSLHPRPL